MEATMNFDPMYFVVGTNAIMLDDLGTPVICDVDENGSIDWDSFDLIDWLDVLPDEYQLYKSAVDFLQAHSSHPIYVK
jgi:hypothetical protein